MQILFQVLIAGAVLLLAGSAQSAAQLWRDVTQIEQGARAAAQVRYFEADNTALRAALADSPHESSGRRDRQLAIPLPDGSLALFSVQESPILAPELGAKYPEIRTFRVFGVDDDYLVGRIDITPLGFHGMLQTRGGRVLIDPDRPEPGSNVYRVRYASSEPRRAFNCGADHGPQGVDPLSATARKSAARVTGQLQQYRLAVAVTNEYYLNPGFNDDGLTTAAIGTTINRVNFVYERDLGIRLQLIGNNNLLYESVDNGELNNEDEFDLLEDVNGWIDTRLPGGDADYDIGHIFSRPGIIGGGVAFIGAVCDNNLKGGGVSGLPTPTGDAFNIDLVAHEIGHQFDAEHTFNGTTSSCINRNPSTAYEPGSGSSIMAYSGICASENLQTNSDASFHSGSIAQIDAYTAGAGGTCATLVATTPPGNIDPAISAIDDLVIPASTTIPANTPFVLGASASDADLDALEYRWDQVDAGCPTDNNSFGSDNGSNALFRGYEPRADSWRNFPALGTQIRGRYDDAEVLPCQSRALDFRVTVTDGNSGRDAEDVRVVVDNSAGPFVITNLDPDPGIVSGTPFQVDWDVAGTDLAPINCANVRIDLLAFNPTYARYTIHALATVANIGSAMVNLADPTRSHPRARVRVKCSDNIFYDVSDTDLNITAGAGPGILLDHDDLETRVFANGAITSTTAPACPAVVDCTTPPPPPSFARNGDASSFGFSWLLLLGGLAAWRRLWPRQG